MEQKPRKVAALYARVSTLDQNCEVQLEDLRRHAGKRFASYCDTPTLESVEPNGIGPSSMR